MSPVARGTRDGARRLDGATWVLAVAGVLTVVMAAPVLWHPATRLFGREIVGRHHTPYTVVAQFENPRPPGLYTQPATDYPGALLARALGDGVPAYNLMVLVSFPLAAVFAFLLARHLTGSAAAAWVAALAYAFLPFHWSQAAYHPHGAQTQWLPLYLLALWLCAESFDRRRAALLVLAAALVALSSFYYGLIAATLTPVALGAQWLLGLHEGRTRPHRSPAATAAALAALAAAGGVYVVLWAPEVLSDRGSVAFPRADLDQYTARWSSYLVPPVDHALAGDAVRAFWQRRGLGGLLEQQLTLGAGLLALAAVGLFSWLRGPRSARHRTVPVLVLVAAAAFVFSLPPIWSVGAVELPAPSSLLYALAPMFRAHARFGLAVGLAMAILAGIGFADLSAGSRRARIAAVGLAALAVLELAPFPPWRWRDVLPTTAHRWLASRDEPVRLLDCVDGQDRAQHSVGRFLGKGFAPLPPFADCGDPQVAARFASRGFSHLLVRRESALGERLADGYPPAAGLTAEGTFADAFLFRIDAPPPPLLASFGAGFHWREYKDTASYRWMKAAGRFELSNLTHEARRASLELVLHAFPERRVVVAILDGSPLAELEVTGRPVAHRLALGTIAQGRHVLELRPRTPPAVPDDLLGNGDRRALTVAVWDWSWTD